MQKVSFSFPPKLVEAIDDARGDVSRNQYVIQLLTKLVREQRERELARITDEVYSDAEFAAEEEELAELFFRNSPDCDL